MSDDVEIRAPRPDDLPALVALNRAYMEETFQRAWNGNEAQLARDLADGVVEVAMADALGFVAWTRAYDLHHCMRGASVCDLYVVPAARGRGVAPALIAHACARIAAGGGAYLAGGAVDDRSAHLYGRIAWSWPTREFILGGRAFRTVA